MSKENLQLFELNGGFRQEHVETAREILTECTDEELYELFGDILPTLAAKLIIIRRKRLAKYSNKNHDG